MKAFVKTCFYMLLSILGLTVLSLIAFTGFQIATGKIVPGQLVTMLRVLDGQRFYTLPTADFAEYQEFLADRKALAERTNAEFGPPDQRAPGVHALEGETRALRESLATARRELALAEGNVHTARAEVNRLQNQLDSERKLFMGRVAKEAAVEAARNDAAFGKIMGGADADMLAPWFERTDPREVARLIRQYLPTDTANDVLAALPVERLAVIAPLIEDPNYNVPPRDAALLFARRREIEGTYAMGPMEIYQNLVRMNAAKALATLYQLPEELQAEVVRVARVAPLP